MRGFKMEQRTLELRMLLAVSREHLEREYHRVLGRYPTAGQESDELIDQVMAHEYPQPSRVVACDVRR